MMTSRVTIATTVLGIISNHRKELNSVDTSIKVPPRSRIYFQTTNDDDVDDVLLCKVETAMIGNHRNNTSCRKQQQVHLASCLFPLKRKCPPCKFMETNDWTALMQHQSLIEVLGLGTTRVLIQVLMSQSFHICEGFKTSSYECMLKATLYVFSFYDFQ